MEVFGKLLSLLSIPLMLLGLVGIIHQVNKEQRLSLGSSILGMVMAPAILVFNLLILRQASPSCAGPIFLVIGCLFGFAWGLTMRLVARDNGVFGKQSILHLVFWGVSLTFTQVLILLAPAGWVSGGLVLMYFSTGTTLGTNSNLLMRWAKLSQGAH
jgi:hypothetical protein